MQVDGGQQCLAAVFVQQVHGELGAGQGRYMRCSYVSEVVKPPMQRGYFPLGQQLHKLVGCLE